MTLNWTGQFQCSIEENVKKVKKLVHEDARIKIQMLAEMIKLSAINTILHNHLNLLKVSVRWVLPMLTIPQKQVQVECCRDFQSSVLKIHRAFSTRLLSVMKHGFITVNLKASTSPYNGIKRVQNPQRSSKSLHRPENSWSQCFGT